MPNGPSFPYNTVYPIWTIATSPALRDVFGVAGSSAVPGQLITTTTGTDVDQIMWDMTVIDDESVIGNRPGQVYPQPLPAPVYIPPIDLETMDDLSIWREEEMERIREMLRNEPVRIQEQIDNRQVQKPEPQPVRVERNFDLS